MKSFNIFIKNKFIRKSENKPPENDPVVDSRGQEWKDNERTIPYNFNQPNPSVQQTHEGLTSKKIIDFKKNGLNHINNMQNSLVSLSSTGSTSDAIRAISHYDN